MQRHWKQTKSPLIDKWIKYINGILSHENNECCHCSNMEGHYAKGNKQDIERQTLYNITYMWDPWKIQHVVN